jgi:gamma-glutamyltranspeptidase
MHSRGGGLDLESFGWNRDRVADSLSARGWSIRPLRSFPLLNGDVQAIGILEDGRRQAAADPRNDGAARAH